MNAPRVVACDESGYEGEKLVGGVTDVFTHAGVDLTSDAAAGCVAELRERIRSPALEYKANHLLREKNRRVLEWLLDPAGPVYGHAHVYLVDKTFWLVQRVVEHLVDVSEDDGDPARALHLAGPATGAVLWGRFLATCNDLLRERARATPAAVARAVDELGAPGLLRARPEVRPWRGTPPLDLLAPALAVAAAHWGADGPVAIVHDRQTTLTDVRVARMMQQAGATVTCVRLVDSRTDPRVQVADFVAGVARKVASEELAGRGDAALLALLAPYVETASIRV